MNKNYGFFASIILITLLLFCGCIDSNMAPKASFTINPEDIQLNEVVTFTSTSTDEDGEIVNFTWSINNDIIGYTKEITYQFNENGTYIVNLLVTDDQKQTDQKTKNIYLGINPENIKQLFIGTWEWEGDNQTGYWSFFQNDSSVTTFQGMAGASVTDWWHYEIMDETEICFSEPKDPLLTPACYQFTFYNNFTELDFTYNNLTERWYKVTD